jgi:release factor glutamine methyltransferase
LTLHERLAEARARLVAADISQPEASIDVELYVRTILGWDRARLLSEQQGGVPERLEPTLSEWIARRERREPSAYIVGVREFWGLPFAVTPAVLIPRPETEFIVEEALAVARGNAARHGVADRIEFVATSYLDGVDGRFEVITANPPYVKDGDKPALSRAVRHEPEVALFGGAEGLRDITGVLDTAAETLIPGGWLVMEFGYGQEESVEGLVDARPALRLNRVRADLQGIPRTAIIQRR